MTRNISADDLDPDLMERVLAAPITDHDAPLEGAVTLRDYLTLLLADLWEQEAGFDGKRPWGNSGWQVCVWKALIVGGIVEGELDEDGFVRRVDTGEVDRLVGQAIRYLGQVPPVEIRFLEYRLLNLLAEYEDGARRRINLSSLSQRVDAAKADLADALLRSHRHLPPLTAREMAAMAGDLAASAVRVSEANRTVTP